MEIQSSFNSGVQGFQNAVDTANRASANIASQTTSQPTSQLSSPTEQAPSITDSIVALNVAETQAQASAKVIETADEALGTIIDVSV